MTATPTKLRNGSWGARVHGTPVAGQEITIEARSGKRWTATVAKVLWTDGSVSIAALGNGSATKSHGPRRWTDEFDDFANLYGEGAALRHYGHSA